MTTVEYDATPCPICRSDSAGIGQRRDDRYGYPGRFSMYRCPGCSHIFLDAPCDEYTLTDLYTNYYPRSQRAIESFKAAPEVKGFMAWLDGCRRSAYTYVPENVRVLDIGCGFGETLAYHKARGCEVYGVEADGNIRRVAEKFGFNVHVGLFDPDAYEPEFFDYVTLDQVVEHTADPLAMLLGAAQVLKPSGKILLSTPNVRGWAARLFRERWIHWHAPYHRQFFSPDSFKKAAKQAGLVISKIRTISPSDWLMWQWIHLLTFPEEGTPSPFWSPKGVQSLSDKVVISVNVRLHALKLNHLLCRFWDCIGRGDNWLVMMEKPKHH